MSTTLTDEQLIADVAKMVKVAREGRYAPPYRVYFARDGVMMEWRVSARGVVTEYRDGVYVSRRKIKMVAP